MPYIGKQLVRGQNRELDDISSSFNGAATTFNLTIAGDSVTPGSALQLFISVGGVLQNPNTDFTVIGNQITFTSAPGSGLSFFGYLQGDAVDINTPADSSVNTAKLVSQLNINLATATPASAAATGTEGDIAWDTNYIYVCVATDTWKRVGISTW